MISQRITEESSNRGVAASASHLAGAPTMDLIEEHAGWPILSRVPLLITAGIPLPGFKVRDLVSLAAGQVLQSNLASSEDVPVMVGAVHFAWSEFEVVGQQMAVRLTRLA